MNLLKCVTNDYITTVGKPERIITDNGTQFQTIKWHETLTQYNIKARQISLYHPQSNISERYIKQVKQFLTIYTNTNQRNWIKYLKQAEDQINHTHSEATAQKPYEIMFGK